MSTEVFLLLCSIIGLVITILTVMFYKSRDNYHLNHINEYIHSIGGRVVAWERKIFLSGPFKMLVKGDVIYKVEYEMNGIQKAGWVRFGLFNSSEWIL